MPIVDRQANANSRGRLIAELRANRLVSLTGAGLSAWAGYPTWQGFLSRVTEIIRQRDPAATVLHETEGLADPLERARRLASFLGADFERIFREDFGPRNTLPDDVIYRFASLPFRHHATLNFDPSIPMALTTMYRAFGVLTSVRREDLIDFLRDANLGTYPQQVLHLHGKHDDPIEQIVLTESGYTTHYADNPLRRHFLWNLFATHRLVFAGFGFTDVDFLNSLRECCRHTRIDNQLRHFAIIPLADGENDQGKRAGFAGSWDTDAVFYEIDDQATGLDRHRGFKDLLVGIAAELNIHAPQAHSVVRHAEQPGDADDIEVARRVTARTRGDLGRGLADV